MFKSDQDLSNPQFFKGHTLPQLIKLKENLTRGVFILDMLYADKLMKGESEVLEDIQKRLNCITHNIDVVKGVIDEKECALFESTKYARFSLN